MTSLYSSVVPSSLSVQGPPINELQDEVAL